MVINSWRNILTSTVVNADIGVAHETEGTCENSDKSLYVYIYTLHKIYFVIDSSECKVATARMRICKFCVAF